MGIKEQQEYNDNYQKEYIRRIVVKFNKKMERDQKLLEHLLKHQGKKDDSVQSYIKKLIEADMEK